MNDYIVYYMLKDGSTREEVISASNRVAAIATFLSTRNYSDDIVDVDSVRLVEQEG